MYHPTPYHWTTGEGPTHVFYDNHMPPSSGFGWSSLCDRVRLPIEGKHFELQQDVTEENITCEHCRRRLSESYVDLDDGSIASANGCLVWVERNEGGVIIQAERVCQGMLHHSLSFEPDTFSEDLTEQVEDVCKECWETYVNHQWRSRDEGAQFCVELRIEDNRSEYFAANAETIQRGHMAVLRLVSKNGLKKDLPREEIESITLTPARNIVY